MADEAAFCVGTVMITRPGLTSGGSLFVILAKYAISFFNPVHGRVPRMPMPISRVAARTRVSSNGSIVFSRGTSLIV